MSESNSAAAAQKLIPISPMMIFPSTMGQFSVYLRQDDKYVLYSGKNERFTERHREALHDIGVSQVFILPQHKELYDRYVEENLGRILNDEDLPLRERAGVLYNASVELMRDTFETSLPMPLGHKQFERLTELVRYSASFLTMERALKAVAGFISHDYKTFTHSVQVFVYVLSILSTYDLDKETLVQSGLGAILHDLGKARIPKYILYKPGSLTDEEREQVNAHPVLGVSMCAQLPLSSHATNTILFHHERMDGKGYPTKLKGEDIPLCVRVASVCDVYDMLITNKPYAQALRPYEALKMMRDGMKGAFDLDVYKRLITVLSGAEII
ncbi:HD-GYP domain-containing protein [Oceanidesulfovibrio marinus]|nr:HD domain-containing phosphohydrolase [Oceanidesulfovibrio marinus]